MDDTLFETERLVVREWRSADSEPFCAMARDRQVMRHLLPASRAECGETLRHLRATQARHGHAFWAVERKRDCRFIGLCGLMPPQHPLRELEIGWRFVRDAWGKGYAREAAQAALDWCWANLAADSVVAVTVAANTRSWGLMERLGMTRHPDEDFDHPELSRRHPLRRHIFYRIRRPV